MFKITLCLIAALVVCAQAAQPEPIAIVSQDQEINPDGSFKWSYETENGIKEEQSGNGDHVLGKFEYVGVDGKPIQVSYTADENGFQPTGDHIPVAPPIPEAILRSLEYNAAHPQEN